MHASSSRQLLLALLLAACSSSVQARPGPIGSYAGCGPGTLRSLTCWMGGWGYVADVTYYAVNVPSRVSLCDTPWDALNAYAPVELVLAEAEFVSALGACSDSVGLRGLLLRTNRGRTLSCGSISSSCLAWTGGGAVPLGGFYGSCLPAGSVQGINSQVAVVHSVCWNPYAREPTTPPYCLPGTGTPGGGRPCTACPVGYFSAGGYARPCAPCPDRQTTLTTGSPSCGCFPGFGLDDETHTCQQCEVGTYSPGGNNLTACIPCSHDPADYLTSPAGSASIASCTCKAGYGASATSPSQCSQCPRNFYNPGPLLQARATLGSQQQGRHPRKQHTPQRLPWAAAGDVAAVRPAAGGDTSPPATSPTYTWCTPCGLGCTTLAPGSTSPKNCTCEFAPPRFAASCGTPVCNTTELTEQWDSCAVGGHINAASSCVQGTAPAPDTQRRLVFRGSPATVAGLVSKNGTISCTNGTNGTSLLVTVSSEWTGAGTPCSTTANATTNFTLAA